jgi:hypothetical protein
VYSTVQAALNNVSAGDTIFMRGGRYYEKVSIPHYKQGSPNKLITWRSYPGEWAILDGGGSGNGATVEFFDGSFASCPSYWVIRNFEITGGGAGGDGHESGGGIMLDTAHHITLKYLYIHDNNASSAYNDGGIVIKNDTDTAQYITIKYNLLEDTTCTGNGNCATIGLFSDYEYRAGSVDIDSARHHNEIAFNRVIGGTQGIRSKSWQILTMDHSGQGMTYKDYGDKIHHNIVEDFLGIGIEARQDFIQVYNNITKIDPNTSKNELLGGIVIGCQEYNTDREPFHAVVYNNLSIGSDITIEHQQNLIYSAPIHPYSYFYNNIIENSTKHMESRIDFSVASNSVNSFNDIDISTITFENNLFAPKNRSTNVLRIEDRNMTIDQWLANNYSEKVFNATSVSDLHKSGSNYKINSSFSVSSTHNLGNGGIGTNHPYLSGVTIPSYIGPADPNNDGWIDGVLAMNAAWFKTQTGDDDPSWVGHNNGDSGKPVIAGHFPAKNCTGFFKDSEIKLNIQDNEEGVDRSSIVMTVNGQTVTPTITGTAENYTLTFKHDGSFEPGKVTVSIQAQDLNSSPNIVTEEYSFTIGEVWFGQ